MNRRTLNTLLDVLASFSKAQILAQNMPNGRPVEELEREADKIKARILDGIFPKEV